jgi:hypothetical protein
VSAYVGVAKLLTKLGVTDLAVVAADRAATIAVEADSLSARPSRLAAQPGHARRGGGEIHRHPHRPRRTAGRELAPSSVNGPRAATVLPSFC